MDIDQLANNMITAYIAQMDSALKISEIIAKHNNDKPIESDEIISGLIYRLMIPMNDYEMKNSLENAQNIMNSEISSDEEDDNTDNEGIYNETIISDKPRQIKTNICTCTICSKVRECIHNYQDYIPNDTLADKFKESIQTTCNKHNIIIS